MWIVGIVRTSLVYWVAALAAKGSARLHRIREAMERPLYRKARAFINRWGVIAVPLCFLTVGFQTAVIVTTGFTRMPLRRWIPAMLVGTLMWAGIYTTIGFAILAALGLEPLDVPRSPGLRGSRSGYHLCGAREAPRPRGREPQRHRRLASGPHPARLVSPDECVSVEG